MKNAPVPKKQIKRKPTLNQKKVFDKVLEQVVNGGKISVSKAIRDAGLSAALSRNSHKVTNSKGWKELMDEFLPDSLLAERHQELLNKRELVKTYNKEDGSTTVEETQYPDTQAVKAGLDMAYKLKGSYEAEKHDVNLLSLKDLYGFSDD